jgi:hypothetical protein
MRNILFILQIIIFSCLIAGLVKPSIFSRFLKSEITRKKIIYIFGGTLIAIPLIYGMIAQNNGNNVSTKADVRQEAKVATSPPIPIAATNTDECEGNKIYDVQVLLDANFPEPKPESTIGKCYDFYGFASVRGIHRYVSMQSQIIDDSSALYFIDSKWDRKGYVSMRIHNTVLVYSDFVKDQDFWDSFHGVVIGQGPIEYKSMARGRQTALKMKLVRAIPFKVTNERGETVWRHKEYERK